MKTEKEILEDISKKLGKLIALTKLSNLNTIEKMKTEVRSDNVFRKILDCSDGSLSYSDLSEKVAKATKVSKITVKRKISQLKEMGALDTKRVGLKVYYENSGLLD